MNNLYNACVELMAIVLCLQILCIMVRSTEGIMV